MTTDGGGAMAIAVNGKGSSHEERKKIALWPSGWNFRTKNYSSPKGHKHIITIVGRVEGPAERRVFFLPTLTSHDGGARVRGLPHRILPDTIRRPHAIFTQPPAIGHIDIKRDRSLEKQVGLQAKLEWTVKGAIRRPLHCTALDRTGD